MAEIFLDIGETVTIADVLLALSRLLGWLVVVGLCAVVGAQPPDRVLRLLDAKGLAKRTPSNNPEKAKPKKKAQERAAAAAEKAKAAEGARGEAA